MQSWKPSQTCWGNGSERLLLKAGLLEKKPALQAWNTWVEAWGSKPLFHAEVRLLPLVYRNLSGNLSGNFLKLLEREYLRTYSQNIGLLKVAERLRAALTRKRIHNLSLKGVAFIEQYYKDPGLRPMHDIDLLIKEKDLPQALSILKTHGWVPAAPYPHSKIYIEKKVALKSGGGIFLDLHWHITKDVSDRRLIKKIWSEAGKGILSPTMHLLHTFLHGIEWAPIPSVRWISDAWLILKRHRKAVDWNYLVSICSRGHLTMQVLVGLEYLKNEFNATIPSGILEKLHRNKIPAWERVHFYYRTANRSKRPMGWQLTLCDFYRWSYGAPFLKRMRKLPEFIYLQMGKPPITEVPARLWKHYQNRREAVGLSRIGIFK